MLIISSDAKEEIKGAKIQQDRITDCPHFEIREQSACFDFHYAEIMSYALVIVLHQ